VMSTLRAATSRWMIFRSDKYSWFVVQQIKKKEIYTP
jgi:hypothetical protein